MTYLKTIGLDLRFLNKNNYYSNFIFLLVKNLIKTTPEYLYNIYLSKSFLSLNFGDNTKNHIVNFFPATLKEQLYFPRILKNHNNDLVIFFDYRYPINYKKEKLLFVSSLEFVHFPVKTNFLKRNFLNYLFSKNLKKATNIIVFDNYTKEELNDKFNVPELKIEILQAFFYKIEKIVDEKLIDIKVKYNIRGDFFIYSSGSGVNKNLDKILEIFKYFKTEGKNYNLVILDENTIKDVDFRQKVLDEKLINNIFFIGDLDSSEKDFFYKASLGEIFPLSYSSFPFSLNTVLNYNKNIFSSNLKIIKDIFGEKINYFNINSFEDIIDTLQKNKENNNYEEIFEKYNVNITTKDLIKVIKKL